MTDRAKTGAEKAFKTALRRLGSHVYRDSETGRLVTPRQRSGKWQLQNEWAA